MNIDDFWCRAFLAAMQGNHPAGEPGFVAAVL